MVMDTLQIRLSEGIVERIDALVKAGLYSSRSDVIRDAVRRLVLDQLVGIAEGSNSVQTTRNARRVLSKEKFDIDEINKLA